MREIKFRAWDKHFNKLVHVSGLNFSSNGIAGWVGLGDELSAPSTSLILMQYTGLKDKNGKEIYEGDIWLADYNNLSPIKVKFELGAFNLNRYAYAHGEVIGNIYENPELVKP